MEKKQKFKKIGSLISIPIIFMILFYLLDLCLMGLSAASNILPILGGIGIVAIIICVYYLVKFYKRIFT